MPIQVMKSAPWRPMPWIVDTAPCVAESEVFDRAGDAHASYERASAERRARALCLTCPVLVECAEHSVDAEETWGVWGGMTYRQRRMVAKRHAEK